MTHEIREVPIADLVPHERNYRAHPADQVERIARSLAQHGQFKNIVVQAGTNRIIAGHGVVEAAKAQGQKTVLAMVLDVGDEEAAQILIDDNELARHAEDDTEQLLEIIADLVNTEYQPAAFDTEEIEDLIREVTYPRMGQDGAGGMTAEELAAEWIGLPEIDREGREGAWCVIVWMDNETDRDQFMKNNHLEQRGPGARDGKTRSAYWPPRPREKAIGEIYG
jgi:hypothetical protein